jgi:hypothetical protein
VCGIETRFLWSTTNWNEAKRKSWKWSDQFHTYLVEDTKVMAVTFQGAGKPDIGEKANTNLGSARIPQRVGAVSTKARGPSTEGKLWR